MSILDKEPCCLDRNPVAVAGEVRQSPLGQSTSATVVMCDEDAVFGDFSNNLPITDLISGSVAGFPDVTEADGTTTGVGGQAFAGFPWQVETPQPGAVSGFGYLFGHTQDAPDVDLSCEGSGIKSLVATIVVQQNLDQDPDGNDLADGFAGLELNGVPVLSEINLIGDGTSIATGGGTVSDLFWGFNPTTNDQDLVIELSLADAMSYSLEDLYNIDVAVALEINGQFTFQSIEIVATYCISDSCIQRAVLTKACGDSGGTTILPAETVTLKPDGQNIDNNSLFPMPVSPVRSFTIVKEGSDPVNVEFGNGRSITITQNGNRTFGDVESNVLIDVSSVVITTGANSQAQVLWEAE